MDAPRLDDVATFLENLQDRICIALERMDGAGRFTRRELDNERGGRARPRVLEGPGALERAAVNLSVTRGARLPESATAARPALAGRAFEAASLSMIVHPRNPHAPTTHMNLRCFTAHPGADDAGAASPWWIGGGFDLTPYTLYEDDARHWHATARAACSPFGDDVYPRFKKACDDYFFLPHRREARGIGGIFFDDYADGGFDRCFALLRSVGDHFLPAYLPILARRKELPFGAREREFQLLRRGRYVEFNLLHDRGTRFGLQAGGRIESILASMPPHAAWRYEWTPEPGSPEARLIETFTTPREWL